MKPTAQLDAITEYCPKKKEFVDALASAPRQFVGSTDTCEISDDTVTFSGDVWFDYQPLSDVGDIDLTVSVYMKKMANLPLEIRHSVRRPSRFHRAELPPTA